MESAATTSLHEEIAVGYLMSLSTSRLYTVEWHAFMNNGLNGIWKNKVMA
jgi:ubiquinone biosynthesis protein Coq4